MARVTVEDCLDKVDNRFELVMIASKRARMLSQGGKDPLVPEDSDKPTVIALRELADGHISREQVMRDENEAEESAMEMEIEMAAAAAEDSQPQA